MSEFVCEKVFLLRVLLHYFMKKASAEILFWWKLMGKMLELSERDKSGLHGLKQRRL